MRLFPRLREDIAAIREHDPAARSLIEVLMTYPGLYALWAHRIEHFFYRHHWYFFSKLLATITRFLTGIEIHPGAKIGRGVFIDHGMGLVIGETAVVGNHVVLFHGVTLGGTGKDLGKRHPTLEDNVFVSAQVQVLGPITIGKNTKIGAASVVLHSLPANATAVGIPAEIVKLDGQRVNKEVSSTPAAKEERADDIKGLHKEVADLHKIIEEMKEEQHDSNL
ncbi:serine O-acetyltransferase EpsC [Isobaculum melis]|uniref:Serine acetyltransferase n=1 Tax=Isobaculum melis TaxID=142588 RepID=A0A1H9SH31_9LACT|nr:serine O-acetyltransferase EpsC [Isobaculum melis]SER84272.1 serine O-acetyltransferase [Isobaculum melis]